MAVPTGNQALEQALSFLFFLVVFKAAYEIFFSPLRHLPGPLVAKCTDIWRALSTTRGNIDQVHRDLHSRYGPAVRVGPSAVSVSDPTLIRTIYATKNPWRKSNMYRPNDVIVGGQRISNLFNTQDNDWHEKFIKPVRGFWNMTKVLEVEPLIDETITKFTSKITDKFATRTGSVCMMDEWIAFLTWDITANVSFGRHWGFIDQEKDVDGLIRDSTNGVYYFAPISQIPWLDYLLDKNPFVRIGPKPTLSGVLFAFQIVAEYTKSLSDYGGKPDGKVQHYLGRYTSLRDTHKDLPVDDTQVVNWLMMNILAGGDTTAATIRAGIYHLLRHPTAQRRLVGELVEAQVSTPAQWKEIQSLPYLTAVVRETLRLTPGIAMIFEREVPKGGVTLQGRSSFFVPEGTKIGINPGVTNRDNEVFGDETGEFRPERWLQGDFEGSEDYELRLRKMRDTVDFTFGGGNRVCVGKNLALLEFYKSLATIYLMFDIELVNPKQEWKTHNAWFAYQWDVPVRITQKA